MGEFDHLKWTYDEAFPEKIPTRAVLKETITNYISIQRLINAEFEKKYKRFIYLFVKAKEAGKE